MSSNLISSQLVDVNRKHLKRCWKKIYYDYVDNMYGNLYGGHSVSHSAVLQPSWSCHALFKRSSSDLYHNYKLWSERISVKSDLTTDRERRGVPFFFIASASAKGDYGRISTPAPDWMNAQTENPRMSKRWNCGASRVPVGHPAAPVIYRYI